MTIPKGTILVFKDYATASQFKSVFINETADGKIKNTATENVVLLKEDLILATQTYLAERDDTEFSLRSRIVELEAMKK